MKYQNLGPVGKCYVRFVCLSKGEIDCKSLRNTSLIEELRFLEEESVEGLVLLIFVSATLHRKGGGGVGWVGFVLARLTCCELPFPWPELMCAKLYTRPTCISRKSGTVSNWEPNGDASHLLQFPHGPWTRDVCVKSRPAAGRSLFWGP